MFVFTSLSDGLELKWKTRLKSLYVLSTRMHVTVRKRVKVFSVNKSHEMK